MPPLGENDGKKPVNMVSKESLSSSSFHKCKKDKQKIQQSQKMIASLRNEVCQLQVKCDDLEQTNNFSTIKLKELNEVINAYKNDEVHMVIMQKAMKSSELKYENAELKEKIKKLEETKLELLKEIDNEQSKNVELGKVIKSLQCANYSDTEDDGNQAEDEEENEDFTNNPSKSHFMTPEKAFDMTLRNMKMHIEYLEDERQRLATKCKSQSGFIESLTKEKELFDIKLQMMEDLVRQCNASNKNDDDDDDNKSIDIEKEEAVPTSFPTAIGTHIATSKAAAAAAADGQDEDEDKEGRKLRRRAARRGMMARSNSGSDLMANEHRRSARAAMGMARSNSSSNLSSNRERRRFRRSNSNRDLSASEDSNNTKIQTSKAFSDGVGGSTTTTSRTRRVRRVDSSKSLSDLDYNHEEDNADSSTNGIEEFDSEKAKKMKVVINGQDAAYTGPLKDGKPSGTGTIRFKNGDTYLGELENGKMHGKGTLYHKQINKGISRGRFNQNTFLGA